MCTNKLKKVLIFLLIAVFAVSISGCSGDNVTYDIYENSKGYKLISGNESTNNNLFAKDLCVTDGSNIGMEQVESQVAGSAVLANRNTKEIKYSQNVFDKMFPASTTKILTAMVCVKYANLDDTVTVSQNACNQTSDSSVCGLKPGDRITYRDLLYGLLLRSGNDAAIAIAEGMSGSVEEFAKMMNKEANLAGATHSHFVNANGLHNDDHYTTVYDMYLMFDKALDYKLLHDIVTTTSQDVAYTDANGNPVQQKWYNTNLYLTNQVRQPQGITVLGGKTGTTNPAGYCLVLLSRNSNNEELISIVFNADCRQNLYYLMNQILDTFGS
ncbi:MAG: D-alanyl-D-alanine carboxypeptidase [Lachnospiraceae bacterium]|nr:D-alanyl-D-alanine carboxypeptidase [Lachnospiraceae bacterium]